MLELLLLAVLWGGSFLLLRITSPVFGPIILIEIRVLIGLLVLLPFLFIYRQQHEIFAHWRAISFISLTNMCLPFCLLAFASLSIGAGLVSILNATVPFFAAIFGYLFFSDKLSRAAIAGLPIGFIGVVVLILADDSSLSLSGSGIAFLAGLGAASLYGLSTSMINRKLLGVSGLAITVGSLFCSTLYLLPFAIYRFPDQLPRGNIWFGVFILGALCTGLAYILFYRLIMRIGAYQTVTVTYLVPVFSIIFGMTFLGESLNMAMFFGCLMVLCGVAVTTGRLSISLFRSSTSQ